MKIIIYRAVYDTPSGLVTERFRVRARNVDSGWAKAIRLAVAGKPKGWRLHIVEFEAVDS
jgi:hypothetical protein